MTKLTLNDVVKLSSFHFFVEKKRMNKKVKKKDRFLSSYFHDVSTFSKFLPF